MEDRGAALVLVLLLLVLVSALGLGISLMATAEVLVSANARENRQALFFAEAGAARALADLGRLEDWTPALRGELQSSFVDGEAGGVRTLPSGGEIDLTALIHLANCGKTACAAADLVAVAADRPWGADNPRYSLFAYGPASNLAPEIGSGAVFYVVVMVADDPSETDGDPTQDATAPDDPGRGVIQLRAEAFGPRGCSRAVEVTLARSGGPPAERGYAGQLAGGETNERRSHRTVGTPGTALPVTRIEL